METANRGDLIIQVGSVMWPLLLFFIVIYFRKELAGILEAIKAKILQITSFDSPYGKMLFATLDQSWKIIQQAGKESEYIDNIKAEIRRKVPKSKATQINTLADKIFSQADPRPFSEKARAFTLENYKEFGIPQDSTFGSIIQSGFTTGIGSTKNNDDPSSPLIYFDPNSEKSK